MYAGHIGIAIAATARRPDIPLAVLVVASLLPDLLVHPLFHTVPGVVALVAAACLVGWRRWDGEVAMLLSALVLSHFLVDLLTSHLDVWPGNDLEIGLGLYDVPPLDFALEAAVIIAGWFAWRRSLHLATMQRTRPMLILLLASQAVFAVVVSGTANER